MESQNALGAQSGIFGRSMTCPAFRKKRVKDALLHPCGLRISLVESSRQFCVASFCSFAKSTVNYSTKQPMTVFNR
jgi:hypothetical protein